MMKSFRVLSLAMATAACVFALVIAAGCSSSTTSSASGASGGDSAASASSAASSAAASASAASVSSIPANPAAEKAEAEGYQVFEGTVRVVDAEQLIKLQDIDIDPAAASGGGTYAVLVFDKATDVTGESADGSGQRTESALMLGIAEHTDFETFVVDYGDLDAYRALDGQHVTLAARAQDIVFPSDVSLPIGQPKASMSELL